jgi:hypothetical protein
MREFTGWGCPDLDTSYDARFAVGLGIIESRRE